MATHMSNRDSLPAPQLLGNLKTESGHEVSVQNVEYVAVHDDCVRVKLEGFLMKPSTAVGQVEIEIKADTSKLRKQLLDISSSARPGKLMAMPNYVAWPQESTMGTARPTPPPPNTPAPPPDSVDKGLGVERKYKTEARLCNTPERNDRPARDRRSIWSAIVGIIIGAAGTIVGHVVLSHWGHLL